MPTTRMDHQVDLDTARFLVSSRGWKRLAEARATRDLPPHRRVERLRRSAPAHEVRAALEQDALRVRARARFPHAEVLLFTSDGLEQATAWAVAEERATRWPMDVGTPLTDLGAGIGIDALAAAWAGRDVVAWERDAARACLLAYNARVLGVGTRVRVEQGDVLRTRPRGRLAFLDPDRRPGGRRTRRSQAFEPPGRMWADLLSGFEVWMVKLPPAPEPPADLLPGPQEVVSLGGRARERRLLAPGFGRLPPRRALCLPAGASLEGPGLPWPDPRPPREGDWLLDPDPAVTLAGLVGDAAARWGLRPVHPRIAYLLGSEAAAGAPGHWVHVEAGRPARARAIDAWLGARGIGRLTIRTRGVAGGVAAWRRRLHPRGAAAGTLVVTRDAGDRWVALAGREPAG